jgi:hypothetical protein
MTRDAEGNVFLAWAENNAENSTIQAVRYDVVEERWSEKNTVGEHPGEQIQFEMATNQLGDSIVVSGSYSESNPLFPVSSSSPLTATRFR